VDVVMDVDVDATTVHTDRCPAPAPVMIEGGIGWD
jgi:hypothetical protein